MRGIELGLGEDCGGCAFGARDARLCEVCERPTAQDQVVRENAGRRMAARTINLRGQRGRHGLSVVGEGRDRALVLTRGDNERYDGHCHTRFTATM